MAKFKYHGRLITASTKAQAIRIIAGTRQARAGKQSLNGYLDKVRKFLEGLGCTTEDQLGFMSDVPDEVYDGFVFYFPGETDGWNTVEICKNGKLSASVRDGESYTTGQTLSGVENWLRKKVENA